jgi:hypothetical protein
VFRLIEPKVNSPRPIRRLKFLGSSVLYLIKPVCRNPLATLVPSFSIQIPSPATAKATLSLLPKKPTLTAVDVVPDAIASKANGNCRRS